MRFAIACGVVVALAGSAMAQTWAEAGDAGGLPGGAQTPVGVGPLTTITGEIAASNDFGDFYRIYIGNPAAFSATTNINAGTQTDSALYLFNLDGTGIVYQDDIDGVNFLSTIPLGHPLVAALAPGEYLLLVSGWGMLPAWDPTPAVASLVFPFFNDSTLVYGPQSNQPMITNLFSGVYSGSRGTYTVTLEGATFVPAPATAGLLGVAGLMISRRRRA